MVKSIQQNKKVYFRGFPGRADEIIAELEKLGGKNPNRIYGYDRSYAYFLINDIIECMSLYVFKRRACFESYEEAFLPEKPIIQNIKDVKALYIGDLFKQGRKEYRVISDFYDKGITYYVAKTLIGKLTAYANIFCFDQEGNLHQHI